MKISKIEKDFFCCISINVSDIQHSKYVGICLIATIWGIYFMGSLCFSGEQVHLALRVGLNKSTRDTNGFF